jgi:hypothetical protein
VHGEGAWLAVERTGSALDTGVAVDDPGLALLDHEDRVGAYILADAAAVALLLVELECHYAGKISKSVHHLAS